MTADVINLRRARKTKERKVRDRDAEANRQRFGRTKAEREKVAAERKRSILVIEAHRRDDN